MPEPQESIFAKFTAVNVKEGKDFSTTGWLWSRIEWVKGPAGNHIIRFRVLKQVDKGEMMGVESPAEDKS